MDTTQANGTATRLSGLLKRRGVLAGVTALAGAGLAKLLGPGRAEAGHDGSNTFHLGTNYNTPNAFGKAHLKLAIPNDATLDVINDGTTGVGVQGTGSKSGVAGFGTNWGVSSVVWYGPVPPPAGVAGGRTTEVAVVGMSSYETGVYGIAEGTGPNLTVGGVVGTSQSRIGVLGTSNTESVLVGVSGGAGPGATVAGAVGTSTTRIGVLGTSSSESGVLGISAGTGPGLGPRAGVAGTSTDKYGVFGTSSTNTGVHGLSTSAHGVFGQTSAPAGTVVNGMLAAGVTGRTGGTIALYGFSDGPPNPNYAPVGGVGQCNNGFGVWGLSSAGPGTASRPGGGTPTAVSGVLGTSASNVGVYAISSGSYALAADGNGPNTVGALIRGNVSGKAAVFVGNVEITGHLTVTGGVNGPVGTAQADSTGARSATANLQAMQSREAVIEDFGQGRLTAGRGDVRFEPAFVGMLPDDQYDVFLTEYDDHRGLYVTGRTRQGFEVRAKDSPTASSTFSYRVVGRPRTARTATDSAPTPLHVPTIPVPQGVPTLPTQAGDPSPTTPPSPPAPGPRPR
jgi:hypothetical protein